VFDPDETKNYELGIKGQVLDGALQFDASLYYIDWSDVQLQTFDPSTGRRSHLYVNANGAKSRVSRPRSRPGRGKASRHRVVGRVERCGTHGRTCRPNLLAVGHEGDTASLQPGILRLSLVGPGISARYRLSVFLGGLGRLSDDRLGHFVNGIAASRTELPRTPKSICAPGVRGDQWQLVGYVNNVGDERGVLAFSDLKPVDYQTTRPRTIGLTLSRDF
jgi:hypothetical protein